MSLVTVFNNYLTPQPYLTEGVGYLAGSAAGAQGMQAFVQFQGTPGMQALATIPGAEGMQAFVEIEVSQALAMEAKADTLSHVRHYKYLNESEGYLTEGYLSDKMCAFLGMQANVLGASNIGMQANAKIYNTTNLRILCNFTSRGTSTTNWTATSTEPGDFDVNNLDTDIVEQYYRSATGVLSVNLTTDTGIPQGVFVDTVAVLGHNLTSSATVSLLGSNDPTFASVNTTIAMQWTDENMYWLAPTFPNTSSRYWRFVVSDINNPDNFLKIGTIIFGEADIFSEECITDQIRFQIQDFADKIPTEGFTNVSNSRTIKKQLGIEFRSIQSRNRNFKILRSLFTTYRTTHKCLWIPTPSATDMEVTGRFAVFGKLPEIPVEAHNSKGPAEDYVDLNIDVDESL